MATPVGANPMGTQVPTGPETKTNLGNLGDKTVDWMDITSKVVVGSFLGYIGCIASEIAFMALQNVALNWSANTAAIAAANLAGSAAMCTAVIAPFSGALFAISMIALVVQATKVWHNTQGTPIKASLSANASVGAPA